MPPQTAILLASWRGMAKLQPSGVRVCTRISPVGGVRWGGDLMVRKLNWNENKMPCMTSNPFTAALAAQSLEKRPTEVPNLKSLRLFPLFAWTRERISTKMHSIESRFVIGPSAGILLAGVYVCTFQPGIFTTVKGLNLGPNRSQEQSESRGGR